MLERALTPQRLDALFEKTAQRQYTRKLLFSTTVDLMALVVCRVRPSVHAAYQSRKEEVGVTVRAMYDKLECLEPGISAALVRQSCFLIRQHAATLVTAALRATHKKVALDEVLSDFYVAEELAGTYRGMMIALPEADWKYLAEMSDRDFVAWLTGVAKRVRLDRYPKSPRGPKNPRPRRTRYAKAKHIATAQLMADAQNNK